MSGVGAIRRWTRIRCDSVTARCRSGTGWGCVCHHFIKTVRMGISLGRTDAVSKWCVCVCVCVCIRFFYFRVLQINLQRFNARALLFFVLLTRVLDLWFGINEYKQKYMWDLIEMTRKHHTGVFFGRGRSWSMFRSMFNVF